MDEQIVESRRYQRKVDDLFTCRIEQPIHFQDERLTTDHARRIMTEAGLSRAKQRKRVDRLAAQFILQGWLETQRRR